MPRIAFCIWSVCRKIIPKFLTASEAENKLFSLYSGSKLLVLSCFLSSTCYFPLSFFHSFLLFSLQWIIDILSKTLLSYNQSINQLFSEDSSYFLLGPCNFASLPSTVKPIFIPASGWGFSDFKEKDSSCFWAHYCLYT